MERSVEIIERISDRRPRCWRGPRYTFSDRTAGLLAELGPR
jgi:hypothetical protein